MPFAALAVALLVLAGPVGTAAAGDLSKPSLAQPVPVSLLLAFDDNVYGDRDDDEDDNASPDNFNYGDNDDDEDDSAHGPGDDDDGWDIDPYERSERA